MNFSNWLLASCSGGVIAVIVKLYFDFRFKRTEQFYKDMENFRKENVLGQEKIHETFDKMSDGDLESSAKSVDSSIRSRKGH